jgi:hypothetical protein
MREIVNLISRRTASTAWVAAAFAIAACGRHSDRDVARDEWRRERASASAAAESAPTRPPGALPFEFPSLATAAKKGDFVLAPSKSWIDEAFAEGIENQTFIYYGAFLVEPGEKESRLRTLSGQRVKIPNALILPVGHGETAKPGDVVLTAWASGSGLQRAIVVEGGSPERPKARYLDIDFENPSGWAQKDDELPENTFHVLTKPGELGTTLACKEGERKLRFVLVADAGEKLLGLGFAGKLRVIERASCAQVAIDPKVKPGDKVFIPVIGSFIEAKVTKIDAKIGRVWAAHEFGGAAKEEAIGFTNVAPSL